ncbi:MAG: glycosyltransferase [Candidatus Methanomethyliaceae archaeon]
MRLTVISDGLLLHSGEFYYSQDTFLFFLRQVATESGKVVLCAPCRGCKVHRVEGCSIPLRGPVDVVRLWPADSVISYYLCLPLAAPYNAIRLSAAIKRCDAVVFRLPNNNALLGYLLAGLHRKRMVAYVVGDQADVVKNGRRYRGLLRLLALGVAGLHGMMVRKIVAKAAVSFFLGDGLRQRFGGCCPSTTVFVTSLVRSKDIVRRVMERDESNFQLMYAGRLAHEKGLEYLLEAVACLVRSGECVKLVICGDGPDRGKLVERTRELGLTGCVIFRGHVEFERLREELLVSDVFVLPSLSEGIPKVLLEAMANGVPVVATAVGGVPDVIRDGFNGLLVQPRDPLGLADSIRALIRDDALRQKIIEGGYQFVSQHTVEAQASRFVEAVRAVLR